MITVNNLSFHFGTQTLFKDVNLKFSPGECYGVIGANGAGKSTFIRLLCRELEPSSGEILIPQRERLSVLRQDHFAFDSETVLDTILGGNERLLAVQREKDALYAKEDFTDEDGIRASELEGEFAEMGGWEAESEAARLVDGLGLSEELLSRTMSELRESEKVKVLLARALFGQPEIILLDEPTNGLDAEAVLWLEDFLADYFGTVLVVSHDRHFLNDVCTAIVDIDYGKINMYIGNYEFWYESSRMVQSMIRQQNKRAEEKIRELEEFIRRFSANKSKSRQATSRRKLLDRMTIEELPASSRRYPFIGFDRDREAGKDILTVKDLAASVSGEVLFRDLSFLVGREDKIAFLGNELAVTALFRILAGEAEPDSGSYKFGVSITTSYFPHDNTPYFEGHKENLVDFLRPVSRDQSETYLRGFLGRMLFSGDSVYKSVEVLSGGEKARCMFARMMLFGSNLLMLDQPTDHLDLESISALNHGLSDFGGNILFATHDFELMNTVANRIIILSPDGCRDFRGTYEEYLAQNKGRI